MKIQLGQKDILFPIPAALIVSGNDSNANICTIAWIGMVSCHPPIIGASFSKEKYSLKLIRDLKEFTVNIPSADYYKETDYCGIVSGKKRNKFADTGFTPVASTKLSVPIIKECPLNLECSVIQEVPAGDHILVLAEIVETHIDSDKANLSGNRPEIQMEKVNPLIFASMLNEYWSIGEKLGNAFYSGKEIKKELE